MTALFVGTTDVEFNKETLDLFPFVFILCFSFSFIASKIFFSFKKNKMQRFK